MAQTTYQKIEEYIDLAIEKGYSFDYIMNQLDTKYRNYADFHEYPDLCKKLDNAFELDDTESDDTESLESPDFLLVDFLKEKLHPKPAYLSDLNIHPAVIRYFNALYNLIDDYELYFASPCNPDEFIAIEEYFEIKLPKAFKDFYLITNGGCKHIIDGDNAMIQAFHLYYFPQKLSIIIEASKTAAEYYIKGSSFWEKNGWEPKVHFKSLKPMLFTESTSGNYLWFDFDETFENGMEIIDAGVDTETGIFVAKNFEELLDKMSECMEKEDGIIIYYLSNPSRPYHFEINW